MGPPGTAERVLEEDIRCQAGSRNFHRQHGARESSTGNQRELHCGKKTGTSLFSIDFPWPEHEQGCTVQHRSPKEQTLKARQGPEACFPPPSASVSAISLAAPGLLTLGSCSPEHSTNYLFQLNHRHRILNPMTQTSSRTLTQLRAGIYDPD